MKSPSAISRLITGLRRMLNQPAAAPLATARPTPAGQTEASVPPMTRKVSVIIINPLLPTQSGRRLTQVLGWNDPDRLVTTLINDLREVSHGYANYEIAERILSDEFPVKMDGFQYTGPDFLNRWRSRSGFHQPDDVDYLKITQRFDLAEKVNSGQIDEVWTLSFPYAGFYESRMAGPGAFWCNAPPLENSGANRRFVIMAFNYERGVGEMLESYGHRSESIMQQVYTRVPDPLNLWKRFTLYDSIDPGRAEVGNIHYAPNSLRDYDWGNPAPVLSHARTWQNFPDLSAPPAQLDSRAWGSGDIRAHHRWWFSLLPYAGGKTNGVANNWWQYIVDPNLAP